MNIHNTTLEQWRIFQAIVDYGGFAQAAKALHKSQSTISYSIKKLQQQLGQELFQLQGKKAVLTEKGKLFLRQSRLLSQQLAELQNLATNLEQGWEHQINLVVETAFPTDILFQTLKKFEPLSRGTRVQYIESVLSGSEEAIFDSRNDLVISGAIPPNYYGETLVSFDFIGVTHPNNPLLKHSQLRHKHLQEALQIVVRDSGSQKPVDAGWLKARHQWTVSNLQAAKAIILNGLGFAWLPEHMIQEELKSGALSPLPLEFGQNYRVTLYLIFVHQDQTGPASRLLAHLFKQTIEDLMPQS